MPQLWVNDSGVARQIREVWVNDSGVARRINEIWVNDAGTARRIFVGDQISIADYTANSTIGPTAFAEYGLTNGGDIIATTGGLGTSDVGDWITPQSNMSSYECRATLHSGAPGGTFGAWMSLSTTRSWTLSRSSPGISDAQFTLEIRRASDSVVLDSALITLEADVP